MAGHVRTSWFVALWGALVLFAEALAAAPDANAWVWQNPSLSPNGGNNIHNDSYLSDSYTIAGPQQGRTVQVLQRNRISFKDPFNGRPRKILLGICGSHAFDAQGNVTSICAGIPDPRTKIFVQSLVTFDKKLNPLAFASLGEKTMTGEASDVGGVGYFYQDNSFRIVATISNGHIQVFERQHSQVSDLDKWVPVRDINIADRGGLIPVPQDAGKLDLFALVPDKAGNIWFTTTQGIVGVVSPDNRVRWSDINDREHKGVREPARDGEREQIANSHAIDEGDSAQESSGVYIVSTHAQYKFVLDKNGDPTVAWREEYDRGAAKKPGQLSRGSGTSPTVFRIKDRRFVAIADNAKFMNINVYRAETHLREGEKRVFAQIAPFGNNEKVCDENSLVVLPGNSPTSVALFAENNWGNMKPRDTLGSQVTEPGFARVDLDLNGEIKVTSVNEKIRVPSVVSKVSVPSGTLYTYEKRSGGWWLTALDARDLNKTVFSLFIGPGLPKFNNFYAAISLAPDGKSFLLGTVYGLTKVTVRE